MTDEERRILIAALAKHIMGRFDFGQGPPSRMDLMWGEETALRIIELIKAMEPGDGV